ncbi:hypothetical protein BA895_21405 [Humibacillus sp. DSM 29435]|nr:hypothetical protein BA895_21405 [Humibacillus sp. DSM 29435]
MVVAVGALALSAGSGCTWPGPDVSPSAGVEAVPSPGVSDQAAAPTAVPTPALPQESPIAGTERMLRARVAAVSDGAREHWLAPVAGSLLRERQGQVFDRMRSIGVIGLRLVSVTGQSPVVSPPALTPSSATPPSSLRVKARFSYRLAGFDTADRTFDVDLSVHPAPSADGEPQVIAWAPHDRPQPWDLDHLTVRRSATSLVLAGSPHLATDLLARADAAQSHVAAVWGRSRPAVWVAPATDTEAALLLGRGAVDPVALRDVAAVTDGPLPARQPAGADRIVIVPKAWISLSGRGRDVVAAHELTHVVVRGSTTGAVPLWLSEGFAEFVAYRAVSLPEGDIVRPAVDAVRRSGLPRDLPTAAQFDPAAGGVQAAYGLSLLVVRTLAERDGVPALVRFYREVADTSERSAAATVPTPDGADDQHVVDHALVSALHTNRAGLVRDWRARVAQLVS